MRVIGGPNNEKIYESTVDSAGSVLATGEYVGPTDFDPGPGVQSRTGGGGADAFLLKLSSTGAFVWVQVIGGLTVDRGWGVVTNASNAVFLTGTYGATVDFDPGPGTVNLTSNGSNDVYLTKYTAAGSFVVARSWGGASVDDPTGIDLDSAGFVLVAGYFFGTVDFNPGAGVFTMTSAGSSDVFVSKFNNGAFIDAYQMGGIDLDRAHDVTAGGTDIYTTGRFKASGDFDPDGGVHTLTSNDTPGVGFGDVFVSRVTP